MLFEIEFLFPALRSEFIECGAFGQYHKNWDAECSDYSLGRWSEELGPILDCLGVKGTVQQAWQRKWWSYHELKGM